MKRTLMYVGGLMVATGGPATMYTASDYVNGLKQPVAATASATPQQAGQDANQAAAPGTAAATAPIASAVSNNAIASQPLTGLSEVLRFDISVEWVLQHWPRVSTGLSHMQLQGYRVPLVSGTAISDVAGSLTYYFNAAQQAKRITLRGTTGDPSVLVNLLITRFHFTRRLTNDPSWIVYESVDSADRHVGTLKIRSASVINASQPRTQYNIDFELDRPE